MRYQQIAFSEVSYGMAVRVTAHNQSGHGTLIVEDRVIRVHVKHVPEHSSILGSTMPAKDVVESIELQGLDIPVDRRTFLGGYMLDKIERALPPLPTTPGSAVALCGRVAVLRILVNEPDGVWVWADTGEATGPVLGSADIIHEARR